MAYETFKPEIWEDKIERELEKSLVFGALANKEYQGNITRMGDTVHINRVGATKIGQYTGLDIDFESPNGSTQAIKIDKAPYFALTFDSVDVAQAQPGLMDAQVQDAAYRLADDIDVTLAKLHSKVSASTTVTKEETGVSILAGLTKLSMKLKKANVPTVGRWVVISPEMEEKLLGELDGKVLPQTADMATINGYVGRIRGFDVFVSNNVQAVGTVHKGIGGISKGLNFLGQLSQIDAGKHEKKFGEYVKGLELYGADVLETEAGFTSLLGVLEFETVTP